MKWFLLFAAMIACSAQSKADISYIVAPVKESEKGRIETTKGMRGDKMVYRLMRIDRAPTGSFDEYVEEFFVGDVRVLCISVMNGDRMIDCQNLGEGVVSFYFKGEAARATKLLVGKDAVSAEVYELSETGFYRAFSDERRREFLNRLTSLPKGWETKQPNQRLEPTPTAVTPAASAAAAPAVGAAHH